MKTTDYWTTDFDGYLERNKNLNDAAVLSFFSEAITGLPLRSIKEYGCNIGKNLTAVKRLYPHAEVTGCDLNSKAVKKAGKIPGVAAEVGNILDSPTETYDLVFTKGVLIHIHPDDLPAAYDTLYYSSNEFILIAEYYNPCSVEIEYRGKPGLLWKRDFAGEMLDRFPDLRLDDYGFRYHRDIFPQDDINWFVLNKE